MLKLIKYDLRKNVTPYVAIVAILLVVECYLLWAIGVKDDRHIGMASVFYILLGSVGIIYLMLVGIVDFSRELNSKTSYMTFMAPVSTYKVIGSKYITLFITSTLGTALYVFLIVIDFNFLLVRYTEITDATEMMKQMFSFFNIDIKNVIVNVLITFFAVWTTILVTVAMAYLAITLSATVLSNNKGRGWLALLFFILIRIVLTKIIEQLPTFDYGDTFAMQLLNMWPSFVADLLIVVGSFFGVAYLLRKKVSL